MTISRTQQHAAPIPRGYRPRTATERPQRRLAVASIIRNGTQARIAPLAKWAAFVVLQPLPWPASSLLACAPRVAPRSARAMWSNAKSPCLGLWTATVKIYWRVGAGARNNLSPSTTPRDDPSMSITGADRRTAARSDSSARVSWRGCVCVHACSLSCGTMPYFLGAPASAQTLFFFHDMRVCACEVKHHIAQS